MGGARTGAAESRYVYPALVRAAALWVLVMALGLSSPVQAGTENIDDPASWSWPSVVPDQEVRQSVIDGGYTTQELHNIYNELKILESVSVQRRRPAAPAAGRAADSAGVGASAGPGPGPGAGSNRWPPYFDPQIRFGGRAMRNLETVFGGGGEIDKGMPDRTNRVTSIIAKGDRVWITWLIEGHHTGPMFGLEPTGKAIQVREISMLRFRNDKIIELDMMGDELGLYLQAGGTLKTQDNKAQR